MYTNHDSTARMSLSLAAPFLAGRYLIGLRNCAATSPVAQQDRATAPKPYIRVRVLAGVPNNYADSLHRLRINLGDRLARLRQAVAGLQRIAALVRCCPV